VRHIPREAREGLMRAWLEILRERHPDVTWVAGKGVNPLEDERESMDAAATV
jgi:hypothetical protein